MKKYIALCIFCILFLFVSSGYAADIKITALTEDTAPTSDDLLVTVDEPGTSPVTKKTTIGNVFKLYDADSDGVIDADKVATLNQDTTGNAATATDLADYASMYNGAMTDGHLVTYDSATKKLESAGVKITYTEPAADAVVCRTGSSTTGECDKDTDIGSATKEMGDLYIGTGKEIKMLDDQSVKLAPTTGLLTLTGAFATTGYMQGGIKINSDANGMTGAEMSAAGMYGTLFVATGAGTWTLPTAVEGMSACLKDSGGAAHDLILDVQADDDISLDGDTELTNGTGITNASGSSKGDFVCVIAISAGHWVTLGTKGTWASQ